MEDGELPRRSSPAKGVHLKQNSSNHVFLTVCTDKRDQWLARPDVHTTLHDIWQNDARAWLVGDYLIMPDHLHLFCVPNDDRFEIEQWTAFWKDRFAKRRPSAGRFQRNAFHHRLRSGESYALKWDYVRENPVRAGLVQFADEWPYSGTVHEIR